MLIAAAGLGPVDAARANEKCELKTLSGLYVFSATGFIIPASPAPAQPKAIIELLRFNGDGTVDTPGGTRSLNGVITQNLNGTGTYTLAPLVPVDRGCTGSLTFLPSGPHFDLFLPADGDQIRMIQTDPNNVFQGTVTKLAN
jgi:hypothetical protein